MLDFKVWEEVEPPKGTVYNRFGRSTTPSRTSLPPDIAVRIYNRGTMPTMLAKLRSSQAADQVISWASDEP
jgi:hypothetical protein